MTKREIIDLLTKGDRFKIHLYITTILTIFIDLAFPYLPFRDSFIKRFFVVYPFLSIIYFIILVKLVEYLKLPYLKKGKKVKKEFEDYTKQWQREENKSRVYQKYSKRESSNYNSSSSSNNYEYSYYFNNREYTDNYSKNTNESKNSKISTYEEAAAILGVTVHSSEKEIKEAFYRLMLQYHPDRHVNNKQSDKEKYLLKTQQIVEARNFLLSFIKKSGDVSS